MWLQLGRLGAECLFLSLRDVCQWAVGGKSPNVRHDAGGIVSTKGRGAGLSSIDD